MKETAALHDIHLALSPGVNYSVVVQCFAKLLHVLAKVIVSNTKFN